ncbi:MAG TPA: rod shape-determining protein MreD [Candidatus Omnitrophota bacterium]|nr:rod shape-determining protein MreD [Candidatus Omnitrophota bacterium]
MLKKYFILAAIIFVAVFLELNYPRFLSLFGIRPDFFIIFVVYFNLHLKRKNAILFSGLLGLIKDILSFARFGTNAVSFMICSLAIDKIKSSVYQDEFEKFLQLALVFLISLLNSLIFYFLNIKMIAVELTFVKSLFFIMIPEAFYTTLVSPLIYTILKKCDLRYSV